MELAEYKNNMGAFTCLRSTGRMASVAQVRHQCAAVPAYCRGFLSLPNPLASVLPGGKKQYKARRVFRHSPELVYSVVADVDRYQEFVPYTTYSKVLSRSGNVSRAELCVGFPPVSEMYVSTVTVVPGKCVQAVSADTSLFKHLRTLWTFHPAPTTTTAVAPGLRHHQHHHHCLVDFVVEYEFTGGLHAALASQFFDEVSKKIVSAFEERCDRLYPSSIGGR